MSDAPEHGWLIHKAGRGWYRPNAHGYTSSTAEAGRFSRKDALEYSHPNGWSGPRDNITIKHESEICDRKQLPRIQLYTEDQYAASIAREEAAEAALAVAEEALTQAVPALENAWREIAELENVLSSYRENWAEAQAACSVCSAALAKIAALKGGEA